MAEIPAPLMSRRAAIAVAVVSVLGAAASIATIVTPIGAGSAYGLLAARQVLFAVQALVLAVGVGIAWLTLARRTIPVAGAAFAALAGFALLALTQLVSLVRPEGSDPAVLRTVTEAGLFVSAVLLVAGLLGLGVAVLRARAWRGPTRVTLLVSGLLLAASVAAAFLAPVLVAPLVYALWSLSFLGLASGLLTPRRLP